MKTLTEWLTEYHAESLRYLQEANRLFLKADGALSLVSLEGEDKAPNWVVIRYWEWRSLQPREEQP